MRFTRRDWLRLGLGFASGAGMRQCHPKLPGPFRRRPSPTATVRRVDASSWFSSWNGGNDGLNTVVPYRNDVYYRCRPHLNVPANGGAQGRRPRWLSPADGAVRRPASTMDSSPWSRASATRIPTSVALRQHGDLANGPARRNAKHTRLAQSLPGRDSSRRSARSRGDPGRRSRSSLRPSPAGRPGADAEGLGTPRASPRDTEGCRARGSSVSCWTVFSAKIAARPGLTGSSSAEAPWCRLPTASGYARR